MKRKPKSTNPNADVVADLKPLCEAGKVCSAKDYSEMAGLTLDGARLRLNNAEKAGLLVSRLYAAETRGAKARQFVLVGYEHVLEANRPNPRDLRKEKRLLKKAVHRFATMQLVPAHAGS